MMMVWWWYYFEANAYSGSALILVLVAFVTRGRRMTTSLFDECWLQRRVVLVASETFLFSFVLLILIVHQKLVLGSDSVPTHLAAFQ